MRLFLHTKLYGVTFYRFVLMCPSLERQLSLYASHLFLQQWNSVLLRLCVTQVVVRLQNDAVWLVRYKCDLYHVIETLVHISAIVVTGCVPAACDLSKFVSASSRSVACNTFIGCCYAYQTLLNRYISCRLVKQVAQGQPRRPVGPALQNFDINMQTEEEITRYVTV